MLNSTSHTQSTKTACQLSKWCRYYSQSSCVGSARTTLIAYPAARLFEFNISNLLEDIKISMTRRNQFAEKQWSAATEKNEAIPVRRSVIVTKTTSLHANSNVLLKKKQISLCASKIFEFHIDIFLILFESTFGIPLVSSTAAKN